MGHGDAHKGDGPREGGDAGGQQAGQQNQLHPEPPDVHPHVLGVHLPQLVGPDGLGQQEGQHQRDARHPGHEPHILPGGAGEAAQGPVVEVDDVGIVAEGHHEVGDGGADVADHDAAHHQHGHIPHPPGHEQHKAHGDHGPGEGHRHHSHGADQHAPAEEGHQRQGHRQLGPRRDAQHKGPRDGVGEKGLEQEAGHRQRAPQDGGGQHPGQADAPDDAPLLRGEQGGQHLPGGQVHAAGADIPHQQAQRGRRQQDQSGGGAEAVVFHGDPSVTSAGRGRPATRPPHGPP